MLCKFSGKMLTEFWNKNSIDVFTKSIELGHSVEVTFHWVFLVNISKITMEWIHVVSRERSVSYNCNIIGPFSRTILQKLSAIRQRCEKFNHWLHSPGMSSTLSLPWCGDSSNFSPPLVCWYHHVCDYPSLAWDVSIFVFPLFGLITDLPHESTSFHNADGMVHDVKCQNSS